MTLYSDDIAKAIRQIKLPYPNFSSAQHITIMEYLNMVKKLVETFGVKCDLEVAEGI